MPGFQVGPNAGASQLAGSSSLPSTPTFRQVYITPTGAYVCLTDGSWTLLDVNAGDGTVTSVSIVTANGFSGSVANASTTPAITLNNPTSLTIGAGAAITSSGAGGALGTGAFQPQTVLTGTTGQIAVSNGGVGATTLSTPQDINTSSAVQFGSLGLGVAPPSLGLKVQLADAHDGIVLLASTGTNAAYQTFNNTGGNMFVGRDNSGGTAVGAGVYGGFVWMESNHPFVVGTNNTARVTVSNAGAVRFHTYGAGTATFDASGNITSVSDESVKQNIRPFTRGLNAVMGLKPIMYGYTRESGLDQTKTDYAGFSAQNVREFIPEAVGRDGNGHLTLDERPILGDLVNSIQELKRELDADKKEIARLRRIIRRQH